MGSEKEYSWGLTSAVEHSKGGEMMPETALNPAPIQCERCLRTIVSFEQWFSESCGGESSAHPLGRTRQADDYGHHLTWPKIMLLTFRTAP